MSNRIALIGAKEGPWTGIKWVKDPVLRISGLKDGVIDVKLKDEAGETMLLGMSQNGDYNLVDGSFHPVTSNLTWIKLTATHPTKSLICVVIPAKAA